MKTYKELQVWQLNQELIKLVVNLKEKLPNGYAFEHIWKQLFRAISSAGANVAEGQSNYNGKEFQRYISISINSSVEADHWIATLKNILANNSEILSNLENKNVETIKMLKGLYKSIAQLRNEH